MTTFPPLFKFTSKGQIQQWQIFVEGDSFFTVEGIKDGKLTTSAPTVCKPKNVGKANETTGEQQAELEAKAKHQKKLDTHYNEVLTEERSFYEPMLAHKYEDHKKLLFTVPTFIQPKFDGVRAINQNNSLTSRGGKFWVTCPHLHQDSVVLDGELYNHRFKDDFNALTSLFKKQKPSPEDLEKTLVDGEMWCYDMPSHEGKFSERYAALKQWHNTENTNMMIKIAPTYQIHTEEELEQYHTIFLEEGYEGSIIRLDLNNYENKRSKQVLKYKVWQEEEFEVVGFEEATGNKAGCVGKVILRLNDGTLRLSGANLKATFERSRYIFSNQHEFIGKMATVTFQNFTPEGFIRIGYVKEFDRNSYETV